MSPYRAAYRVIIAGLTLVAAFDGGGLGAVLVFALVYYFTAHLVP